MGYLSMVSFFLGDGAQPKRPPRFCHSRPIIGSAMRMTDRGDSNDLAVSQWIHVTEDGSIDDVLLQTNKGWIHVSGPMLEEYNKTIRVGPAVSRGTQAPTGSLISGRQKARSPSCWYNGEVTVQAK